MADIKQGPGDAGEQAAGYGREIQQRAIEMLEQRKGQLVGWLEEFAQTMRATGQSLREQDQAAPGRYSDQAADRLEQLAGYVRRQPVQQIRQDAEAYAREHPAMVLGGALIVGMLAGRFLRSGSPHQEPAPGASPDVASQSPAETTTPSTDIASRGGIAS